MSTLLIDEAMNVLDSRLASGLLCFLFMFFTRDFMGTGPKYVGNVYVNRDHEVC